MLETLQAKVRSIANLRHLPAMARDPLAFFTTLARARGPIASFDFALGRQWLISSPQAIRKVFVEHHDDLGKDAATMSLKPLFGNGLLTSAGEDWKRQRRFHKPLFQARHIQHYGERMVAAAADEEVRPGVTNVQPMMDRIARRIILEAMFGTADEAALDIADAVETYVKEHEREFMSLARFLPSFVPTRARRQAQQSRRRIEDRLVKMVAERRRQPGQDLDMLARLVLAQDAEGRPLSDEELRDAVATLYFGGTETSSNALSFAIWLLSHHPDIQDALDDERQTVLGGRRATVKDVKALVRHAAVLDEAMRLFPPVWALGRRALRSFEVDGHRIEAGDQLNASAWVVHRDAKWFENPEAFQPERFWSTDKSSRPAMSFLPFGAGQRTCIGTHFARMETVLVLATWLEGRRVHAVADRPLRPLPRVTLRPADGAWVNIEVRP